MSFEDFSELRADIHVFESVANDDGLEFVPYD